MLPRDACPRWLSEMAVRDGCPRWLSEMLARDGCQRFSPEMAVQDACPRWLPEMTCPRSMPELAARDGSPRCLPEIPARDGCARAPKKSAVSFERKKTHRRCNVNVFLGYVCVHFRGLRRLRNTGPKTRAKNGHKNPRKAWAPTVGAHTFVHNLGPFSGLIIRPQQRDPILSLFLNSLSGPNNRDCVSALK